MRKILFIFILALASAVRLDAQGPVLSIITKDSANKEKAKRPKSGGALVITEAEIAYERGITNAYEAVQRLRPAMLRKRMGARTPEGPSADIEIYFDGRHVGPLESLSSIPVEQIREIRYLASTDATLRFGTGHTEGAIIVTSKGVR